MVESPQEPVSPKMDHKCFFTRKVLLVLLAFLLPLMLCMAARIIMLSPGTESSLDGFYHARMAEMGPQTFLAKQFPWTRISVWGQTFADKELLYHAALCGIFHLQRLFGVTPEMPYHFAAGIFMALALAGFLYAALKFKIPPELLVITTVLLCFISPNWFYRLQMLRPHVAAVASLFFVIGFLLSEVSFKRKAIVLGIFSFFYAWLYSNPHFIVFPAVVFAVAQFRRDNKQVLLLPVIMAFCILLGLTIHPQVPNALIIWKLQSWDALLSPMHDSIRMAQPTEMQSPGFGWHLTVIPLYVLAYAALWMQIRLIERVGLHDAWIRNLAALGILSVLFTCGIFVSRRAIEYAAPLDVLWFFAVWTRYRTEDLSYPFRSWSRKSPALLYSLFLVITIVLCSFSITRSIQDGSKGKYAIPVNTARWLREHVPAGQPVLNLDWSDFTRLFYADPDHYYFWGLDPIFAYRFDPERVTLLLRTRQSDGRGTIKAREVFRAFGTRYGVILTPRFMHADYLARNGWKIIEEVRAPDDSIEGWIFALDPVESAYLPEFLPHSIK